MSWTRSICCAEFVVRTEMSGQYFDILFQNEVEECLRCVF